LSTANPAASAAPGASLPTPNVPVANANANVNDSPGSNATASTTGAQTLFVQAGAFSDPANAERLAQKLRGGGYGKVFVRDDQIAGRRMYRVRIGPVPDVAHFDQIVAALEHAGINDAHLALN
jgi:rare lipoprotein A